MQWKYGTESMLMMFTTVKVRTRKMVQLLRAFTTFPEDLSSDSSMHIKRLTTVKEPKCEQNWSGIVQGSLCTDVTQSPVKVQRMLIWVSCGTP